MIKAEVLKGTGIEMKREDERNFKRAIAKAFVENGSFNKMVMTEIQLLDVNLNEDKSVDTIVFKYHGEKFVLDTKKSQQVEMDLNAEPETTLELTEMETQVMYEITQDNFYENGTDSNLWADVFVDDCSIEATKVRGVLSSLIKKGLIFPISKGKDGIIKLTATGAKYITDTYGTECPSDKQETFAKEDNPVKESTTKEKKPAKKAGKSDKKKMQTVKAGKGEVVLKAFTGMVIGVFPIHKQAKGVIEVFTANRGVLKFDAKTLKQLESDNPKFANHIELGE